MTFIKYQHVERFGSPEVEDIVSLTEPCYVFPKIDGTNGSIWKWNDNICFGSRNRQLSLDNDNQGFMQSLHNNENLIDFFNKYGDLRLYGEWLVPHTIKDYDEKSWRQFYVFDVCNEVNEYLHYDDYRKILEEFAIDYIPCMAIVERGTIDQFVKIMQQNSYLMEQGKQGEGIVIKRYGFKNKFGRTTWAKLVSNEFKAKHSKSMGPPVFQATSMIEESIVNTFLTESMIDKIYANIVSENGCWESKMIPKLLHTAFYDLVREECWNFVKANRNPKIDFGVLQKFCYAKVKEIKKELF